jgi:hypothetical protein
MTTITTGPAPVTGSAPSAIDLQPMAAPGGKGPRPYRPLGLRAGLVQGGIVAALLTELVSFVVIRRAFDGHLAAGALTTGRWVLLLGAVSPLPLLALWAHRGARNLDALGARDVPFTTSMAAWSWFVPIVNLGLPLAVLLPLAQASDPGYRAGSDDWRRLPARRIVTLFWVAHVLEFLVAGVIRGSVRSIDSWWLTTGGLATVFTLDLVTCALGIAMVRRISEDHRHRATRLARQGSLPEVFRDHAAT